MRKGQALSSGNVWGGGPLKLAASQSIRGRGFLNHCFFWGARLKKNSASPSVLGELRETESSSVSDSAGQYPGSFSGQGDVRDT